MPNYEIAGTGRGYTGRIIKLGDQLYTTVGGGIEGDRQRLIETDNVSTTIIEDLAGVTDTVTTFISGDTSNFGQNTYYYSDGSIVPSGTQLHYHTLPPAGRSNFMTQHNMNGDEQDVFLTAPSTPTTGPARIRTTSTTGATNTQNNTGGGMSGGGGPVGGY